MKRVLALLLFLSLSNEAIASTLVHEFKNPSFSGVGTSSHWLTIENQEATRKKAIKDKLEAELREQALEEENSILNRFMYNLQSRIYSSLAAQLTENLFNSDSPTGSLELDGNTINYERLEDTINLTIIDGSGHTTRITIPTSGFGF